MYQLVALKDDAVDRFFKQTSPILQLVADSLNQHLSASKSQQHQKECFLFWLFDFSEKKQQWVIFYADLLCPHQILGPIKIKIEED